MSNPPDPATPPSASPASLSAPLPLTVTGIVGWADAPAMAAALHRVGHAGIIDRLRVGDSDLGRRRFQAETDRGHSVQVALPRSDRLADGAVLWLDDRYALVVQVGAPVWLALRPHAAADALALGYAAGNLHWRVRFDGARLLVALDAGDADSYLARLAPLAGRFMVEP